MKKNNKIIFPSASLRLCVINLGVIFALILLSGCFAPLDYNNGTTLSIRFVDNGSSRATVWADRGFVLSEGVLVHHITLRGPSGTQIRTLEDGADYTSFDVIPGLYTITVQTTLLGELYAQQTQTVDVKPGQNPPVAIELEQAGVIYSSAGFVFSNNPNGSITITDYNGSESIVNIPATIGSQWVTAIGDNAFNSNPTITSVSIPGSVTSIGDSAFRNTGLTNIIIPNSVTSIGNYAFQNTGLTSINIPNSVTSIVDGAFWQCFTLTSIIIPNHVTSIGDYAFYNCENLISVIIPSSVTSIGQEAFFACTSLTSINIPNSVTSIGDRAFSYCYNLISIEVSPGNTAYSSLDGVLYNKNHNTLIQYPIGKTDSTFIIPNSVTSIGDYAFYFCTNLISVIIPSSVTSIGDSAFQDCISLTSVTFEGNIPAAGFSIYASFQGDLRDKYFAGGPGTYTRVGNTWTKE